MRSVAFVAIVAIVEIVFPFCRAVNLSNYLRKCKQFVVCLAEPSVILGNPFSLVVFHYCISGETFQFKRKSWKNALRVEKTKFDVKRFVRETDGVETKVQRIIKTLHCCYIWRKSHCFRDLVLVDTERQEKTFGKALITLT